MELVPIGSVVLLKGADKRLMVYGILQINATDGTCYDYVGCLYPEGFIDDETTYMFNHVDIEKIDYLGYIDSEFQVFRSNLTEELETLREKESFKEEV